MCIQLVTLLLPSRPAAPPTKPGVKIAGSAEGPRRPAEASVWPMATGNKANPPVTTGKLTGIRK